MSNERKKNKKRKNEKAKRLQRREYSISTYNGDFVFRFSQTQIVAYLVIMQQVRFEM